MIAGAGSYAYVLSKNVSADSPTSPAAQEDVSSRYNSIASKFDSEIETTEYWTGITKARKKMIAEASGDVLEVSIGTGRNLDYYDWDFKGFNGVGKISQDPRNGIKRGKVKSFTAVDKSAEMLEVAHEKFSAMFPGVIGVRWIVQDAAEPIPGPPRNANERSGNKDAKYDTIVQTMGLCSVNDPVALLKNLGDCVKEEEGRILLLEHGRGTWEWINRILDGSAQGHATQWGCWWNRDLEEIVKESGLEIVKMERWHFGTNWRFELKKPKTTTMIKEEVKAVAEKIQKQEEKVEKKVEEKVEKVEKKVQETAQKKGWW
jgi:methyltransferase OMS1